MDRRFVFVILGLVVLGVKVSEVEPVMALTGVGAKVDRVSSGSLITISARHAPGSELVVVDTFNQVVAGALDQGSGDFEFSFRFSGSTSGLKLIAVDAAGNSAPVEIPSGGLSNELMPPTLVLNPGVEIGENSLGVGGYSFSGSTVNLQLSGDNGVLRTEQVLTKADGGWTLEYTNLAAGTYTLLATSRFGGSTSFESTPLVFTVEPNQVTVPLPLPQPVQQVSQRVSQVVENVAAAVLPPAAQEAVRNVAPQAQQATQVVAPVASAGLLAQLALAARDIGYVLLQAGISGMQYFGFWRKRHPWGIVYDAITKQPVMLATVRLYTVGKVQRLVETDVTSKAGVFSFVPKSGDYEIKVTKPGYTFPSSVIHSATDGEYAHVYRGEKIHFEGENSVVDVSVPVDPAKVNVNLLFKVQTFIRGRIYMATIVMLMSGLSMSLLAVIGGESTALNGFLIMFYLGVLSYHFILWNRKRRAWGNVVDEKGEPVVGVQVNLVDPKFEKLVQRRVTDEAGKYQFIVPEGEYEIRLEGVSYTLMTNVKRAYAGERIVVTGSKPRLIAIKLVVSKASTG